MCMSALSMHRSHNGGVSSANALANSHKVKDGAVAKRSKRVTATAARQPNNGPTTINNNNEPCVYVRPSLAERDKMEVELRGRGIIQQRIFIVARNKVHENSTYLKYGLQERILDLVAFCDNLRIYESDRLTGLLLGMPSHTIFVLEAGDDLLCIFTKKLQAFAEEFWSDISIFQLEDLVTKVYFDTFVYRHLENTKKNNNCEQQKKAHLSSLLDVALKRQHWSLRHKLHEICAVIARHVQTEEPTGDFVLPSKIIEHVQLDANLLEPVLLFKKFYRSLQSFVSLVHRVPFHFDDDLYDWEKPKICFTTKDIFERSPYDVNLTFDVNNPITVESP